MRGKGTKKTYIVPQENALEFDDMYRDIPSFKEELVALRKQFAGKIEIIFRQGNPRMLPIISSQKYNALLSRVELVTKKMKLGKLSLLEKSIVDFRSKYTLAREWHVHLRMLILTGVYDVPHTNYWIEHDLTVSPDAAIFVGPHTTDKDVLLALHETKKRLPKANRIHKYAASYSDVEDSEFVDVVKMITLPYIHKEKLNGDEERLYNEDLNIAKKSILKYRQDRKAGGEHVKAVTPKFKEKLSDVEYFQRGALKKKDTKRAAEKLKKQRKKYKSRFS